MKTKAFWNLWLFVGATAMLVGCTDPVQSRMGAYSYQIAKQVATITDTVPDTLSTTLPAEMGALQMERVEGENILLTFSSLKGDVYTADGVMRGDSIALQPFARTLTVTYKTTETELLRPVEKTVSADYRLTVTGKADLHNETLHFHLTYAGQSLSNASTLQATDILMVAKKN